MEGKTKKENDGKIAQGYCGGEKECLSPKKFHEIIGILSDKTLKGNETLLMTTHFKIKQ